MERSGPKICHFWRKSESNYLETFWTPSFAGVTDQMTLAGLSRGGGKNHEKNRTYRDYIFVPGTVGG